MKTQVHYQLNLGVQDFDTGAVSRAKAVIEPIEQSEDTYNIFLDSSLSAKERASVLASAERKISVTKTLPTQIHYIPLQ